MGGGVGGDDPQVAVDGDHALGKPLEQEVVVVAVGGQLLRRPVGLVSHGGHGQHGIGRRRDPATRRIPADVVAGRAGRRSETIAERHHGADRDQPRLHGASIAQPGRRLRGSGGGRSPDPRRRSARPG